MIHKKIQHSHTEVTEEGSEDDSVFTYWYGRRWFNIHILMLQKKVQYSEDDSVFIYWCDRRWFNIYILMLQKMIRYPHTDTTEDDLEDDVDSRWFSTYKRWFSIYILILRKVIQVRSMMKMYDFVPKLPMTCRDSPISCTVVMMVVVNVEYLPS